MTRTDTIGTHPLRARIVRLLLDGGPQSPVQLAPALGVPLENVSYHVRVLAQAGVITLDDTRHVRGAIEHVYRLDEPTLRVQLQRTIDDAQAVLDALGDLTEREVTSA